MSMMLPVVRVEDNDTKQISRRLSDAARPGVQPLDQENERGSEVEFDASFTFSGDEVLQEKILSKCRRMKSHKQKSNTRT